MPRREVTRVVVAGNVVLDRTPDGGWTPGGPSLYAARTAAALGASVTLVTRLFESYPRAPLAGIELLALPARRVPRYENTYDESGARTQRLRDAGEPIPAEALASLGESDVFILAPAFREFEEVPRVAARVRSICLQGLLRAVDRSRVVPRNDAWTACRDFITPGAFAFLSEEDTADADELARSIAGRGASAFVTRGGRGATLFCGTEEIHRPAFEARPTDPTGAGDVFATSFSVRYAETADITEAFAFALMAGALAVEGPGLEGIPTRAAIENALAKVAA